MEENEAVKAVEQKQRRKRVPVSAERRVVASTATMVKPTRTEKGSIVENVESIERKRRGRKKLTVGSERNAAEQTPAKAESSRMLRAARMEEPVPGARGRKKQNAISNPRKISNTKVKIRGHKNGTGVLNHNAILSEKNIAREITQKPMKTSHAKQPSIKRRAIVKKHHRASNEINESAETKTTREEDRTRRHEPTKTLVN